MAKALMYTVRFSVFTAGFLTIVIIPQIIAQAAGAPIAY